MRLFACIILFALFFIPLYAQNIDPEWVRYETTDGNDVKVYLDSEGNVITLGQTYTPGPVLGIITMKYDAQGNLLWKNKYDTFTTEFIKDCVIDSTGAVYSLCSSIDPVLFYGRFALIKYSATGDTLWTLYYGGNQAITNNASDLLLTEDGNILVAGNLIYVDENDSGLMLLKISPAGVVLWEAVYTEGNYGFASLGVRRVDDAYYVWGRNGSAEGTRFCCMQVDTQGTITDFNVTAPYADYFDTYFTIDRKGDFLVGDHCCQYKLTKYSAAGDSLWQYLKPVEPDTFGPNVAVARLTSIDVDSANNVYAVGPYYIDEIAQKVILTTKFDESGNVIWQKPFISTEIYGSYPFNINALENNVTIGGEAGLPLPGGGSEFLLLQYDLDGNLLIGGESDIDGYKNFTKGLTKRGNTIVLGGIWNPPSSLDDRQLITAKYLLPTSSVIPVPGLEPDPIRVIPNPFRASAALLLSHKGSSEQGTLEVFDAKSRLLYQKTIFLQPGENFIEIDRFEDLLPGLYYFQVRTEREIYVSKAIKAKAD